MSDEFEDMCLGKWDSRYQQFAQECWDSYNSIADEGSAHKHWERIVRSAYDHALELGFYGDLRAWEREVKRRAHD